MANNRVRSHGGGEAIGFVSGFEHPISGLDHVLAMVAVGLWGAQLGAPAVWLLPVTFPMVMAFGGMLGLMEVKLPGVEVCIALSAIALGLMVLREAKPNLLARRSSWASSRFFTDTPTERNCRQVLTVCFIASVS